MELYFETILIIGIGIPNTLWYNIDILKKNLKELLKIVEKPDKLPCLTFFKNRNLAFILPHSSVYVLNLALIFAYSLIWVQTFEC